MIKGRKLFIEISNSVVIYIPIKILLVNLKLNFGCKSVTTSSLDE